MSTRQTYDHRPLAPRPLHLPTPSHPSSARLSDLLEFVKAEFEQVSGESGLLRAQREEYEAMINHHANELNAMRQINYDLERKHQDLKLAYDRINPTPSRHPLPLPRPLTATQPSLFSNHTTDPKRPREDDERTQLKPLQGVTLPKPSSTTPLIPESNVSPPISPNLTNPNPPPPPPPSLPPTTTTTSSSTINTIGVGVGVENKFTPGEEFDPDNVARELKKEGSDWMTMFNPNVKRVLDVGLVHTLVHDS